MLVLSGESQRNIVRTKHGVLREARLREIDIDCRQTQREDISTFQRELRSRDFSRLLHAFQRHFPLSNVILVVILTLNEVQK